MNKLLRSALLPYPAERVYELVNNVEAYPEFLPGCTGVVVLERTADEVLARVDAQAKGFQQSFTTRNRLFPHERIELRLEDGPFEVLEGAWTIKGLGEHGCKVELLLRYSLAGPFRLFQPMIGGATDVVVDAFVARAHAQLA